MQLNAEMIADAVVDTVAIAVAPAARDLAHMKALMDGMASRIVRLETMLSQVPHIDLDALVLKAAALVPRPENGKDAPPVDIDTLALKAAALVPRPADGRDAAPVDLDVVALKAAALVPRPNDGKDAPPVDIEAIALKAAALIPKPENGRDGAAAPAVDLDSIAVKAAALIPVPRDGKDAAVVDLDAIAMKAAALVPKPRDGKDGADGLSLRMEGVVAALEPVLEERLSKALGAIKPPRDGKDGKDVDAAMLEVIVASHVERAVSAIPKPLDGKSLTPEDVAPLIQAEVTKAAAALTSGRDGIGVSGAVIDHAGVLRLTLSDGKSLECGPVRGARGADVDMDLVRKSISDEVAKIPPPKDGQNGKDGRDGLGFDDLSAFIDEEKGAVLRFKQGDRVEDHVLSWPLYKGPYRAGELYRKLWQVTAQGSLWSAQEDTRDRPGSGSTAWRLVVKRGQDGKDGRDGKDADHG